MEAMLFTTICCLKTGLTDLGLEGMCNIPAALISLDLPRILTILDDLLVDEMQLLTEEEKEQCRGSAESDEQIVYWVDGSDFAIKIGKFGWMYKTHKSNVHRQKAVRAQILTDSLCGFFRGVECHPAGLHNDQGMLLKSDWNQPGWHCTPS